MQKQTSELADIQRPVELYFYGTYEADEQKLRNAFHEKAYITGFFSGDYVEWCLTEFIDRILSKPSQKEASEPFAKRILSIEQKDSMAFVKAQAPAFGHQFTDFILLVKTAQGWKIRHKSFTNSLD
jgi:hypothetical protein